MQFLKLSSQVGLQINSTKANVLSSLFMYLRICALLFKSKLLLGYLFLKIEACEIRLCGLNHDFSYLMIVRGFGMLQINAVTIGSR